MTTFSFDFTLTPGLLASYRRIGLKRLRVEAGRRSFWFGRSAEIIWTIGFLALVFALAMRIARYGTVGEFQTASGGLMLGLSYMLLSCYWQALSLRSSADRPGGPNLLPQHADIDERGLRFSSAVSKTELSWLALYDVTQAADVYVLWMTPSNGILIPRSAFATETEAQAFVAFARAQIAKAQTAPA